MKVKELIAKLQEVDGEAEAILTDDGFYFSLPITHVEKVETYVSNERRDFRRHRATHPNSPYNSVLIQSI